MSIRTVFSDGIQSLRNALMNARDTTAQNKFQSDALDLDECNEIYKTGIGSRIVGLKVNTAFKEGLITDEANQKQITDLKLMRHFRKVCRYQLAFGRGIVVIVEKNKDLSDELKGSPNLQTMHLKVFSGYEVSVDTLNMDLLDEKYMSGEYYIIRGYRIHHTRVVDFRYVMPIDEELPVYNYGGISEYELIYSQLIADGVMERTVPQTVERGATLYYKVKGFKQALQSGKEKDIVRFYGAVENMRNVAGAVVVDAEDQVEVKNQTIQGLEQADKITLRRLAMVTGIPLKILLGENVQSQGLHNQGQIEDSVWNATIKNLQTNHQLDPVNEVLKKLGLKEIEGFVEPEEIKTVDKSRYESELLRNASDMESLGLNPREYLRDKGFEKYIMEDDQEEIDIFEEEINDDPEDEKL